MPNEETVTANSNNRRTINGSTKWVVSIAAILVAGFIAWFVRTTVERWANQKAFQATYQSDLESMENDRAAMKKEVAKNTQLWYIWENVDKVRERDTRQDERIETLQKIVADLKVRLREAERLLDRLSMRTASIEEYVRR